MSMADDGRHTPGLDHWGDITVVAVYFVLVLAVGLWVSENDMARTYIRLAVGGNQGR